MADHMTAEQQARRALSDAGFVGATEADISVLTDLAQAGMRFHGPHTETGTMPVANLVHALRKLAARLSGMAAVPADHVVVPRIPTQAMWDGLARSVIMAFDFDCKSPNKLYRFLEQRGDTVPQWMREEGDMDVLDKVAPKGTRAVLIYRAMVEEFLAAAPEPPHV